LRADLEAAYRDNLAVTKDMERLLGDLRMLDGEVDTAAIQAKMKEIDVLIGRLQKPTAMYRAAAAKLHGLPPLTPEDQQLVERNQQVVNDQGRITTELMNWAVDLARGKTGKGESGADAKGK
jgi:hypothetical protein